MSLTSGHSRVQEPPIVLNIHVFSLYITFTWTSFHQPESHHRLFTPLESPAIYGGDNINKDSIPYRKGGVKAPSFLTGFTHSWIRLNL